MSGRLAGASRGMTTARHPSGGPSFGSPLAVAHRVQGSGDAVTGDALTTLRVEA